jgi:cyclase
MIWTRRDFLGTSMLGLAAAGAFPRLLLGEAPLRRQTFVELRRNVGTFTSRGGTIGWLVSETGTAVVDSQYPDSAAECLAGLEARGVSRIEALINTHHHGDHTGGNGVFRRAAQRIVAHAQVPVLQRAAARAANAETPPTYPDSTFEREWSLPVGDEIVRAKHYGPAHTGGDCTVFFEHAEIVHMGDLVFNRAFPFVDRDGGGSVQGWIRVLEAITATHSAGTIYIFGHALEGFEVTGDRADVLLQRDFFSAVLETVQRSIAAGESREEATALVELPGFEEHNAFVERLTLAAVLGAAYDELRR